MNTLTVIQAEDFLTKQEYAPKWLIDRIIPKNETCLLFGAVSTYKTFVASGIGTLIANLNESLGKVEGSKENPPKVLYLPTEQKNTMQDRLKALKGKYGDRQFDLATEHVDMLDPISVRTIAKTLKLHNYDLLIIDTVSKSMGSGDTANEDLTRRYLTACELFNEMGCAVLLVHHTGHNETKRAKGSTLWHDNVSSVLTIKKLKQSKYHRSLHIVKAKSELEGKSFPFIMREELVPNFTLWADFSSTQDDPIVEAILSHLIDDPVDKNTIRKSIYPTFEAEYSNAESFRKKFDRKVKDMLGQELISSVQEGKATLLYRTKEEI